jgi:hypothetical protein
VSIETGFYLYIFRTVTDFFSIFPLPATIRPWSLLDWQTGDSVAEVAGWPANQTLKLTAARHAGSVRRSKRGLWSSRRDLPPERGKRDSFLTGVCPISSLR